MLCDRLHDPVHIVQRQVHVHGKADLARIGPVGIRVVFDPFPAIGVDREQGERLEVHVGGHAFCSETIDQCVPSGFIQPRQAQQVQMVGPTATGIGSLWQAGGVPSREASVVAVAQGMAPLEIRRIAVQRRTAEPRMSVMWSIPLVTSHRQAARQRN